MCSLIPCRAQIDQQFIPLFSQGSDLDKTNQLTKKTKKLMRMGNFEQPKEKKNVLSEYVNSLVP